MTHEPVASLTRNETKPIGYKLLNEYKIIGLFRTKKMRNKKEELVLNESGLGTEDPGEDKRELLKDRDDGTDEVHKWVSDIE